MSATTSSPMPAALDHLAGSVAEDRLGAGLITVLAGVPDPRQRRGVRHPVVTIAVLAACAVLAGCRSFSAIGQWAAEASQEVRTALGIGEAAHANRRSGVCCSVWMVTRWMRRWALGQPSGQFRALVSGELWPWMGSVSAARAAR